MNRAWMFVVLIACSPSNVASPTSGVASAASSSDSPVASMADVTPSASIAPSATALPSATGSSVPNVVASGVACGDPIMMARQETTPRSADFTRGADAFDRASVLHGQRRFREAAPLFLEASKRFAAASHQTNWSYALYNAVMCFELADLVDEGKRALEDAASSDAAHAGELRLSATKMTKRAPCK